MLGLPSPAFPDALACSWVGSGTDRVYALRCQHCSWWPNQLVFCVSCPGERCPAWGTLYDDTVTRQPGLGSLFYTDVNVGQPLFALVPLECTLEEGVNSYLTGLYKMHVSDRSRGWCLEQIIGQSWQEHRAEIENRTQETTWWPWEITEIL